MNRCITKLFGDLANQFLEKVRTKPEETLKVFLEHLKLHRIRNAKTKQEQNKQWKELCEKNFHKSLDHRAFYFKQEERKNTNTKAFYDDIKKRYDSLQHNKEDSKPIYYNSFIMLPPEDFHVKVIEGDEIAELPLDQVKKYKHKLPQLRLRFDNKEAFEDAYKLVIHQIMNGHNSQSERKKAREIIDILMETFIGFEGKELEVDDVEEFNEEDLKTVMMKRFFFKRMDYAELDYTAAWKKIKAGEMKSEESENDKEGKKPKPNRQPKPNRGHNKKLEAIRIPSLLERGLIKESHNGEPMEFLLREVTTDKAMFLPIEDNVLYANCNFYSFFRHFYCLYERLIKARILAGNCIEAEVKANIDSKYIELWNKESDKFKKEGYEQIYLKGLYSLLGNSIDTGKYEDLCYHCLGTQAYLLFSIDKLMSSVFPFTLIK